MTIYFKPRVGTELDMYCNKVMRHFILSLPRRWKISRCLKGELGWLGWEAAGQAGDNAMCHLEWVWEAWPKVRGGTRYWAGGANGDPLAVSLKLAGRYRKKSEEAWGFLCVSRGKVSEEPSGHRLSVTGTIQVSPSSEVARLAQRGLEIFWHSYKKFLKGFMLFFPAKNHFSTKVLSRNSCLWPSSDVMVWPHLKTD